MWSVTPVEVLRLWFSAFVDDAASARALWSDHTTLHARDVEFTGGFDELLRWYARRREDEGSGFSWQVVDILGGERYAAAIIRLVSDARPTGWVQHAVYEIADDKIQRVWLHE